MEVANSFPGSPLFSYPGKGISPLLPPGEERKRDPMNEVEKVEATDKIPSSSQLRYLIRMNIKAMIIHVKNVIFPPFLCICCPNKLKRCTFALGTSTSPASSNTDNCIKFDPVKNSIHFWLDLNDNKNDINISIEFLLNLKYISSLVQLKLL